MKRLALLLAIAVFGCDSLLGTEPAEVREELGTIVLMPVPGEAHIELPDSVGAGEVFVVSVAVVPGPGCSGKGSTKVQIDSRSALIRPYTRYSAEPVACTQDVAAHLHQVPLQFDQPGEAEIVVYGKQRPGDAVIAVKRVVQVH